MRLLCGTREIMNIEFAHVFWCNALAHTDTLIQLEIWSHMRSLWKIFHLRFEKKKILICHQNMCLLSSSFLFNIRVSNDGMKFKTGFLIKIFWNVGFMKKYHEFVVVDGQKSPKKPLTNRRRRRRKQKTRQNEDSLYCFAINTAIKSGRKWTHTHTHMHRHTKNL